MCCAAMGLRASAISAPPKVKIATSATRIRATVQCRVLVTGRLSVDMARLYLGGIFGTSCTKIMVHNVPKMGLRQGGVHDAS